MPQTCLIAANDPWFIQLLRIYAHECGLRVVQVYESQDVAPALEAERPAVILMQGGLPGTVPVSEMLRAVQSDTRTRKIPVLLFSWQGQAVDEEAYKAVIHLQEPVSFQAFQAALTEAGVAVSSAPDQKPDAGSPDQDAPALSKKNLPRRKAP